MRKLLCLAFRVFAYFWCISPHSSNSELLLYTSIDVFIFSCCQDTVIKLWYRHAIADTLMQTKNNFLLQILRLLQALIPKWEWLIHRQLTQLCKSLTAIQSLIPYSRWAMQSQTHSLIKRTMAKISYTKICNLV